MNRNAPYEVRDLAGEYVHIGASGPHPSLLSAQEDRLIQRALAVLEAKQLKRGPLLNSPDHFRRYLRLRFAGLTNEQGHVRYLDAQLRLIGAEVDWYGHQSGGAFDLRRIAFRAITLGAEAIALAHNHPSGNPTPSSCDIQCYHHFEMVLAGLQIKVLDSFVATRDEITSICERDARQTEEFRARQAQAEEQRRTRRAAKRATARGMNSTSPETAAAEGQRGCAMNTQPDSVCQPFSVVAYAPDRLIEYLASYGIDVAKVRRQFDSLQHCDCEIRLIVEPDGRPICTSVIFGVGR